MRARPQKDVFCKPLALHRAGQGPGERRKSIASTNNGLHVGRDWYTTKLLLLPLAPCHTLTAKEWCPPPFPRRRCKAAGGSPNGGGGGPNGVVHNLLMWFSTLYRSKV